MFGKKVDFSELEGKVIKNIKGGEKEDRIIFECENGNKYKMHHRQECCEDVYIDEIIGNLDTIIGEKVLNASEVTQDGESEWGYATWTFYKIDTFSGGITIRWFGESNGYYSETADFEKIK